MFKEAFIGIFLLFFFYFIYRLLQKKKPKAAAIVFVAVLLLSCAGNIIYNAIVMFPDYYMDIINGRFRYGTMSENLFAYSDEFMFQDEIIFPVLRNRSVSLDESADFYQKFISLYSDSYETVSISPEEKEIIRSHQTDFAFAHEFTCIGIMDYVTDDLPDALTASFEEEKYPMLYIHTASLKGQKQLTAVMDESYSLYVMSTDYYTEITGGNRHE